MELPAVYIGNRIRDQMDMDMVPILVDGDQCLVSGEPFFGKFLPEFKGLFRSDRLILMEGNNVVVVHPAAILIP